MGDYIKIRRLGGGGFGEVWLARHVGLNVDHALKIVQGSNVSTPSEFFAEPRLMKELEHDNVVRVHDAWKESDDLYIAMEVLTSSVADLLDKGPLKLRRIKSIFCDALKGLQFIHDRGYIHRDIKPANILISERLKGKIADFGIAIPTRSVLLATPAGTLTYIAPEVLVTGETSVESDIYAMGVSLYEAINGSMYLPAVTDTTALMNDITRGRFPDRSYYRVYVPRALKIIVNRAMNEDPAKRYHSADEFRMALEQTPIRCSWREEQAGSDIRWTTDKEDKHICVTLSRSLGKWGVTVWEQNKHTGMVRSLRRLAREYQGRPGAVRRVHELTSAMVSGIAVSDLV